MSLKIGLTWLELAKVLVYRKSSNDEAIKLLRPHFNPNCPLQSPLDYRLNQWLSTQRSKLKKLYRESHYNFSNMVFKHPERFHSEIAIPGYLSGLLLEFTPVSYFHSYSLPASANPVHSTSKIQGHDIAKKRKQRVAKKIPAALESKYGKVKQRRLEIDHQLEDAEISPLKKSITQLMKSRLSSHANSINTHLWKSRTRGSKIEHLVAKGKTFEDQKIFTPEEALCLLLDLHLSKDQYVLLRKRLVEKGYKSILPTHDQLATAKAPYVALIPTVLV